MTTIIFSPHEDDETFACGGTIAKKIKSGEKVCIVFMTDGRNSHRTIFGISSNPTPGEVKSIRKKESREAAGILGVNEENLTFLDFEDGRLRENLHLAIGSVMHSLLLHNPDEIYMPSAADGHSDHSTTNSVVLAAISTSGFDLAVYEYKVWKDVGVTPETNFLPPGMVEADISKFVETKKRAISAYKSQTTAMFPAQPRPVLDDAFISYFSRPVERFRKYLIRNGSAI